ncbi:MAG: heparinase II/III-family protein [Clostridium sp.]|nr:heparinase II/III-family protein [Clostridium sp.]
MLHEIATEYHAPFSPFTPYPPVTDRDAWLNLDEEWKKESIRLGEQYLHFDYPSISATDFMDFTRTGNRVRYEDKFFAKRHALCALVLAECIEDNGRFMDDIINGIFSVCEESAWQLPPHNSYVRDTPQLPLPDSSAPVLDLFACETGAILATVHYLLADRLEQVSPFIGKRIRHELRSRIYKPYVSRHFWWMGKGKEPMNNWTIWCTQNVLLSVFLLNTDASLQHSVFLKACKSADFFLKEYDTDGCCDEGAQYYRHAGLCLFNTLEILNAITDNAFTGLYEDEKIKNIASYILNVHIQGEYYVNFADCSPIAGRCGVREFLFAQRTGNQAMADFAATDFAAGIPDTLLLPAENNLYYRLQNAFTIRAIREHARSVQGSVNHPDIYYPGVGIFIARDNSLCLAVKAGDNADSHNHNDTGSFTVYKNGRPLFIDVGVESYTKKTFSAERYEIWTMQSAYHNLPTINGCMQKDGERYHASDVNWRLSDCLCEIRMELAGAYPAESGLSSYRRSASLIKGKEIVIKDEFTFQAEKNGKERENSILLSLMTYEKPVCAKTGEELLFTMGTLGSLRLSGGKLAKIEEIPITDARLQTAWKHELYRILITVTGEKAFMIIS